MHLFVRALVCSVMLVAHINIATADPPSFSGTRFSSVGRNTDGNGLPSGIEAPVGKLWVPADLTRHVYTSADRCKCGIPCFARTRGQHMRHACTYVAAAACMAHVVCGKRPAQVLLSDCAGGAVT